MEQPAIMDVDAISTHSLTRRLTETTYYRKRKKIYFNSQPHKEADRRQITTEISNLHFNSQPHKEADN